MSLGKLFLSFNGRTGRRAYWAGLAVVLTVAILMRFFPGGRYLSLVLLWPYYCVIIKRLHDFGWSGGVIWIANIAFSAINFAVKYLVAGLDETTLGLAQLAPTLLYFGFLFYVGVRSADKGRNEFGSPPGTRTDLETPKVFA